MKALLTLLLGVSPMLAIASQFGTAVEMRAKEGATLYVGGVINGLGPVEWMVDTGSGYMTINEQILSALQASGQARFLRRLRGRLANGAELDVPVYAINAISVGPSCWLQNVEAAVFPGNTRPILGMNVLQRMAPFIFSFEPPQLTLSNCAGASDAVASASARE